MTPPSPEVLSPVLGPLRRHRRTDRPVPGAAASAGVSAVLRRKKTVSAMMDIIDRLNARPGAPALSGAEVKRIMYWNEQGLFDGLGSDARTEAKVLKSRSQKIPLETRQVDEHGLPEFMRSRDEFGIAVPAFFGGGRLNFKKRPEFVAFKRRAWISENVYWRSGVGVAHRPQVRYMIHAILEWAGGISHADAPTPHITLRNAQTQAEIDLDLTHPLPDKRVVGKLEATRASYSQGFGVDRAKGANMVEDDDTFADLTSNQVQQWLRLLTRAAQDALG